MTFREQWEAFMGRKWPRKPKEYEEIERLAQEVREKHKRQQMQAHLDQMEQELLKSLKQLPIPQGALGMGAAQNPTSTTNPLIGGTAPAIGIATGSTTAPQLPQWWYQQTAPFTQPGQLQPYPTFPPPPQTPTAPITPDPTTEARWWLELLIQDRRLSAGARAKLRECLGMLELARGMDDGTDGEKA